MQATDEAWNWLRIQATDEALYALSYVLFIATYWSVGGALAWVDVIQPKFWKTHVRKFQADKVRFAS